MTERKAGTTSERGMTDGSGIPEIDEIDHNGGWGGEAYAVRRAVLHEQTPSFDFHMYVGQSLYSTGEVGFG